MRAFKLPKRLKGPFTNAFYSRRDGIIYLKKENGELESTRAYPSFFIPKNDKAKFPASEFSKYLLDWIDEDNYWRVVIDPSTRRDTITDMVETAEEDGCKVLEADVSPVRRWFSDTGALVSKKFGCLFFDLETHPLQIGFDDEAKKRHRIISFAAYDADGKNWFYAANKSSDEEELKVIKAFFKIAKDYDVLLAWNGDDYDFFVLRARCKYHKLRIDWRLWNWLDHMRVVKKLLMSIPDPAFKRSFALDKVGENVLGLRKLRTSVSGGNLHKLLGRQVAELEAYNRRDVEIMLGIEQKREFLTLQFALCALCRTFPNRGSTFPNELADGTLLRLAVQEGIHFPSRKRKEVDENYQKYEGAYVLDPKVGFHTSIQVPDFASLYPSIILSWNMSNETKIQDGEDYPPNVATDHAVATATGIRFRTDIEGIIPKALRTLISKRNEYKLRGKSLSMDSEEYRSVQHLSTAVKVVTNSFYGLLGNEGSRYHDRDIARSVTLTGQLLIREHIRYFERKGFETVAGDTDSVFVQCSENEMNLMLRDVNDNFIPSLLERVGCRECAVKMDFDKGYKSLLIVTKKRYAGKLSLHKGRTAPDDLEPEIKGLEFQRSDNVRYAQRLQLEYVNLLLDPNVNPDDIDLRLRNDGEVFFRKDLDLEEIVITKGVSKHPSEYKPMTTAAKVAQWLIDEGQEFFVGMKIPYVVIGHKPGITAIHADEYNGTIDRAYYWEKLILPTILRLIRARFPNYGFSDFKQPLQMQFDFANQATSSRKVSKKVTAKKIIKTAKKVTKKVKPLANPVYNIKIPSHAGVPAIKGIAALARSQPGRYKLDITVDLKSINAEVDIETEQFVSMDCLKQIKQMFPKVTITPNPL